MLAVADLNYGIDPPVIPRLCCPFCNRNYEYARPDSLGRHVRDQHLAEQDEDEGFDCPYEGCSALLAGAVYFLDHAKRQHRLILWSGRKT